jgi:uncharacterized protein
MADLFVDTSGWACWAVARQTFHSRAVSALNDTWALNERAVTTVLVLSELTALLTSPLKVPKADQIRFLHAIRNDPTIEVVGLDSASDAAAWSLWESRADKDWTLTDCLSFAVMQQRRLTEALTTDHHFEQAGLVRLLK